MSSWIEFVSPAGREVLVAALQRAGASEQAAFLQDADHRPASRHGRGSTSRQAKHARLTRAMSAAAASVMMQAPLEPAFEAFMLSRDFTYLRPLGAEAHSKGASMVRLVRFDEVELYTGFFERMRSAFMDLARSCETASQQDVLRIQSACVGMHLCAIFFGEAFADAWRSLRDEMQRAGLLNNIYLRLQMAAMGSWVGCPDDHVRWLLDPSVRDFELADTYCFVRSDTRPDLYANSAALTRGRRVDPTSCLFPPRPASTLSHVIDYALACMRDPMHFKNEGLVLMPLVWASDVDEHLDRLERDGELGSADLQAARTRLAKFDKVQLMEKARFFAVVERVQDAALRLQLERHWLRARGPSARASTPG